MNREKPMSRNRTMDMHSTEYAHSMARGLGWFSIGLGLAEVLAPRAVTRGLGMEGNEQLVQAMASAKSPPELGFSRRTSLPHGYGGVSGVMRSIWPRSQEDCSRTIRRKRTWNWLLPPLPASRPWMSSAGPRLRVMPARSHASA